MDNDLKCKIASELNVDPSELTSSTILRDLEYWDSVTVLVIMLLLSEALSKEIFPEEMLRLETFGDIETLVASKIA